MITNNPIRKSGISLVFLTFVFSVAYSQDEVSARREIEAHREKQQSELKDKEKSPLTPKERKKFKDLNYYPIDLKYRVAAKFIRTENQQLFKMKTTTERLPEYVKYGEVTFAIDGQEFKLEVYQSPEIMKRP